MSGTVRVDVGVCTFKRESVVATLQSLGAQVLPPDNVTTVAEQRAHNIHIRDGINEEAFVAMRTARDATLNMPVLMLPSVQVNMRAGHLPEAEDNGVPYLKIPLNAI